MAYKVQLIYFRPTGKFLTTAETFVAHEALTTIWDEVHEWRRLGRLPGLRPNAGRDLFIVVHVIDHPRRAMHLVMPPFVDEDDVTPARIVTDEILPLVRLPLEEIPRTTTRDIVKVDPDADTAVIPHDAQDEDVTPVEAPFAKRIDEP